MTWLIGLLIIWFLWMMFTAEARREYRLRRVISDVYVSYEGESIPTNIYWEAAERFARDRGEKVLDNGYGRPSISCNMLVNGEKVLAVFTKNIKNGTTNVSVLNSEKYKNDINKMLGI